MQKLLNYLHQRLIPGERNNFKSRPMHLDFLSYYLMGVLLLSVFFKYIGYNAGGVLGFATDISIQKLNAIVNEKRIENGLSPLTYNEKLSLAAENKAQDMFNKNYWSHFSPEGKSPWNFILNTGYEYEYAGENLAKNFVFSQGVVDAWMDSPSHRANILRKDYSEVGYAVVNGVLNGEETTLVVQLFAKPMAESGSAFAKPVAAETTTNMETVEIQEKADAMPVNNQDIVVEKNKEAKSQETIVLADKADKPALNLFPTFFGVNSVFFIFIAVVLIIDLIYAAKMNLLHMHGKHIAHLIFLGFVSLGISVILLKGTIL